jgi:hypothetical protein
MIGDITCISVPLALIPNAVILTTIVRDRRRTARGLTGIGVMEPEMHDAIPRQMRTHEATFAARR